MDLYGWWRFQQCLCSPLFGTNVRLVAYSIWFYNLPPFLWAIPPLPCWNGNHSLETGQKVLLIIREFRTTERLARDQTLMMINWFLFFLLLLLLLLLLVVLLLLLVVLVLVLVLSLFRNGGFHVCLTLQLWSFDRGTLTQVEVQQPTIVFLIDDINQLMDWASQVVWKDISHFVRCQWNAYC